MRSIKSIEKEISNWKFYNSIKIYLILISIILIYIVRGIIDDFSKEVILLICVIALFLFLEYISNDRILKLNREYNKQKKNEFFKLLKKYNINFKIKKDGIEVFSIEEYEKIKKISHKYKNKTINIIVFLKNNQNYYRDIIDEIQI